MEVVLGRKIYEQNEYVIMDHFRWSISKILNNELEDPNLVTSSHEDHLRDIPHIDIEDLNPTRSIWPCRVYQMFPYFFYF